MNDQNQSKIKGGYTRDNSVLLAFRRILEWYKDEEERQKTSTAQESEVERLQRESDAILKLLKLSPDEKRILGIE